MTPQGQRGDEPKFEVHLPPDERSGGRGSSVERKLKKPSIPEIASNASLGHRRRVGRACAHSRRHTSLAGDRSML